MADELARRRELRRKKILENAEERKRKIFGSSTYQNSITQNGETPDLKVEPTPLVDTGSQPNTNHNHNATSNRNQQNDVFGSNSNDLETLHNLLSTPSPGLQNASFLSPQSETNSKVITCFTSPVPLALMVCLMLYIDLGYVISNSLALPFILWEVHKMWLKNFSVENTSRSFSFLSIALMLCGIQQSAITTYSQILSLFTCFVEDFALYLFIVVSCYVTIGF
ncbi:uncharacterized protein LOC125030586 [Penaeus chinensis]|uniref:uncharacterized protein LOC125030586 n=1 Tax=Penaeus chinensis TaxID=139456 RepID=UPI001FB65716|nr:uncharacterized protein LOC125030586 [Penaeus chinensis]